MNITRRTILKALGIGSAVAVTGVEVNAANIKDPRLFKTPKQGPLKLSSSGRHPYSAWGANTEYSRGDIAVGTDGRIYVSTMTGPSSEITEKGGWSCL